jgi:hypothetical protein
MSKALVTICSGEFFTRLAEITHPTLKAYAERIGAEFISLTDTASYRFPTFKKLELGPMLERFDRILYVDTDIIIRDDAPNLFELVPADCLGMWEESRYYDRQLSTLKFMAQVRFDGTKWDRRYFNAGVIVFSKCHRELLVAAPSARAHVDEQNWLNTQIAFRQTKMFPLPHRFNRVIFMDRLLGEDRLDAFFLHYAGFSTIFSQEDMLKLVAADLARWKQRPAGDRYPDSIVLMVDGGLGAQAAAEPTVRYARDVIYPGDRLAIVSRFPELFAHLGVPIHSTLESIDAYLTYHERRTLVPTSKYHAGVLSPHQVHPVQRAALHALGLQLPADRLRVTLPPSPADVASVAGKIRPRDVEQLILVHPGRGGQAATFPADVWQAYTDGLVQAGFAVAVIGRRVDEGHGVVEFDRSQCLDLVDRLSLAELIALVSRAPVLVSNDSGPIQLAGAFDNWIGLVAPWHHPDYVLPWRNGTQTWRSAVLERQPLWCDYLHKPSGRRHPDINLCDSARLRQCLPEPAAIVEFARRACNDRA